MIPNQGFAPKQLDQFLSQQKGHDIFAVYENFFGQVATTFMDIDTKKKMLCYDGEKQP